MYPRLFHFIIIKAKNNNNNRNITDNESKCDEEKKNWNNFDLLFPSIKTQFINYLTNRLIMYIIYLRRAKSISSVKSKSDKTRIFTFME